jgi:ATP-dependent RNA helicase DDX21
MRCFLAVIALTCLAAFTAALCSRPKSLLSPRVRSSRLFWSGRDLGSDTKRKSYGGSGRYGKPQMDPSLKLRFKKTIKIDSDAKVPLSAMTFSSKTRELLEKKGFEYMTPVQAQSYEPVYNGDDVVARSRTGTGKTFAFGLPLIEKVVASGLLEQRSSARSYDGSHPVMLVLEPTRELALQVAQELSSICGAHRMRVQAIYGGASFAAQIQAMRDGVHVLVATPGRMLDHISRGTVNLSAVRHVVLDEGDTMLEMGFQKAVESIILNVKSPGEKARKAAASALADDYDTDGSDDYAAAVVDHNDKKKKDHSNVQMLLFSATMPGWICQLTDKHMSDPVFLDAVQDGETRLADTITHYAVRLPNLTNRIEAVTSYVEDLILMKGAGGQTIVFTNTKEEADNLVGSNCFGQLKSAVLHGDIGQNSRQATIRQFKQGTIDVLVATDVAARGLDIAGVDLVVHTGPPNDPDTYVHRAGRTGRAGRSGSSIVLYAGSEEYRLRNFEGALKFQFHKAGPPSQQEICDASALYAVKKLRTVTPEVATLFSPHAREMLRDMQATGDTQSTDVDQEGQEGPTPSAAASDAAVTLLAKCLAAISNRNVVSSRSLLTGQPGYVTLQVEAPTREASTLETIRDWQR